MSKVTYKSTSPWALTNQTSWYLGVYADRPIPANGSDQTIVIDKRWESRPDLLSYDLYGSTEYWWIFMRRNMNIIQDPIYDLVAGLSIYVPSKERLDIILNSR